MLAYQAPLRDFQFILEELLDGPKLHELPKHEEATPDLIASILEEAGKVASEVLRPINQSGDEEGCRYENGIVHTPKGFKEAYHTFVEGGWAGLSCEPEHGGQGLPHTVNSAVSEIMSAANLAFVIYPGLTQGAYAAILRYGAESLKEKWLPKMASGEWSGAMCLTEPHCGTDLGLIRTKAEPNPKQGQSGQGDWNLSGTKIFISSGEQDMTSNIIYLVLARLPNAPQGIKGLSLFLVPKFTIDTNGNPKDRNAVRCGAIEHKMGIKASSTCVMNFDGATGWLVGEAHKGMRAMFTMMNAARLGVAVQGTSISEAAYQGALAYAKERRQGRALSGAQEPDQAADSLIVHPDIRRMLLTMAVNADSCRALEMALAKALDVSVSANDAQIRQDAEDYVALLTPIAKAIFTDLGSESANLGVQIYGGHGYVRDHGMEQYVRDARICQIYEGANGIQALDLIGRKLPAHGGRLLRQFFHPVFDYIRAQSDNEALEEFIIPLAKVFGRLQLATAEIAKRGMKNQEEAAAMSYDYMRIFGYAAFAHIWARTAEIAMEKLKTVEANSPDSDFYQKKMVLARFYMEKILPQHSACFSSLMSGGKTLMTLKADQF